MPVLLQRMEDKMRFDLTRQQVAAIVAMLPDDEDEQLRADMLEGETDLYEMASRLLSWIEEDEGAINALAEQIDTRKERQERAKNRIAARRDMIMALMDVARLDKLALPEATVTKRDLKPKLLIVSDDAVPDEYTVSKRTPDKKAINAVFERAGELPNWLTRDDGCQSITIRRK